MWSYDLAREQVPTLEHLRAFCALSENAGYNAFGLYMEHRFAYPSIPWAQGKGAVTPEMVRYLEEQFESLQIVPFINLLGHLEGFIYTEPGRHLAESKFKGMQACPCNADLLELATTIIDDTIDCFRSELIHIGGDETWQLGVCPNCAAKVAEYNEQGLDGKAKLYGEHFGKLAQYVVEKGRRPAVWGDMFLDHPAALEYLPKETLIFDWQYFKGPKETGKVFTNAGFEVVYCPTFHVYDSVWCHLPQSELNIREHVNAAIEDNAKGVCVTTWEGALFANYETLLPAIRAAGRMLGNPEVVPTNWDLPYEDKREAPECYRDYRDEENEAGEEWVKTMTYDLLDIGDRHPDSVFKYTGHRSKLKCRLLLYSNPFLAWMHHREELCGDSGSDALQVLDRAISVAPNSAYRGVSEFVRLAVEFVRYAEEAHRYYALGLPGEAATALIPCRQIFENLAKIAKATNVRIGGSLADVERCLVAQRHVETVIRRIKSYGDGSLGYLPSFETLTHPKFMPHDQGNWWLINDWGNE